MQSYRPVNALSMCAAVLVLSGGETQAFMVGRRNNFDVGQAIGMRSKDEAAAPQASFSLYDTDERQLQLHPALFAFDGTREASFVQSSGDDDSDDDSDDEDDKQGGKEKSKAEKKKGDKASGHEGKESHGHHGEHDNASKGKPDKEDEEKAEHKEEAAEHKRESAAPASPKGEQHEDEEDEDRKKERKKEEPTKSESLLTSPQEQSKFIMASMKKATDESMFVPVAQYNAMEKLVKVMDYLHGVVALLNQIIQLTPPSPSFSETVMLESAGKKISLKALLDEAGNVRSSVDALFTMLLSAKHSIIGSINRALPARPTAATTPSTK